MRKVCQRLCTCGAQKGYTIDPDRKQWVCALCGCPSAAWYLGQVKAGEVPLLPRDQWGKRSPVVNLEKYKRILEGRLQRARKNVDRKLVSKSTERGTLKAG